MKYAIRLPTNDSLERDIAELLTRQVGRPSHKHIALVQELPLPSRELEDSGTGRGESGVSLGELFPRVGFILTNLKGHSRRKIVRWNASTVI